jgi:hypothetical protein
MLARSTAPKIFFGFMTTATALLLSGCMQDSGDTKEIPNLTEHDTQLISHKEYYISVFSTQKEDSDKISNYLTQKQLRVVASQENGGTRIFAYPPPDKNNLAFIMDEFQQTQKLALSSRKPEGTKVQVFSRHNAENP